MHKRLCNIQQFIGAALVVALSATTAAADDAPFSGRAVGVYECTQPVAIDMPTDVSVSRDGRVFVADGVNNRIVEFDAAGVVIGAIDALDSGTPLSRPIGITVSADGSLWIADTGHGRILARRADGSWSAPVTIQPAGEGHAADITDVTVDPAGKTAWVVDNDGHRVMRVDLTTGTQMQVGRYGESVGQFHFPLTAALGAKDDVFILESMNARIGVFSAEGNPRRAIAKYGINEGELYRPTGLAIDGEGLLWVADASLSAIQVFDADGIFLGALRDESGGVFRFEHCMGLAFDAAGALYVTELAGDRVRRIEIMRGPRKPRSFRRDSRERAQLVGRQARGCTVCHMEWFENYDAPDETTLVPPHVDIEDEPRVSRSATCLSCHDGSVGDSRKRVWQSHGHRTDVVPPMNMKVPDHLPLADGKIKCRTCHTAHAGGQFNTSMAEAVFLRVDNSTGGLCLSCHSEKARGPELGSHPTGGMPWPVPENLIAAGAKVGPNPREITCVVCHTPHGSANDHLLVLSTQSNQLCLSCHAAMRPGMFRDDSRSEHPLFPIVNEEQRDAIQRMGTRLGDDDKLICLSCHKLHDGKSKRFMLAADLRDGEMCLSCHSDKMSVLDTMHDLRTNRPDETNRLGMTASTGGPCSSCHMFHRYARAPEPHPLDRLGQCTTCHQPGRCAGERTLGDLNHAGAACVDCHDPHRAAFDHFMRDRPSVVCAGCHAEQTVLSGGPHDALQNQAAWPVASAAMQDQCLACHRPHSTMDQQRMRIEPCGLGDSLGDASCIACHVGAEWNADSHIAMMHPRSGALTSGGASSSAMIGCRTCHNPHAPPSRAGSLLRVEPGAPASALCIKCHSEMESVEWTSHGSAALAHAGIDADACLPCHAVHANPALVSSELLWPNSLTAQPTAADAAPMSGFDPVCSGCHRAGGEAKPPRIASHPDVPMRQVVSTGEDGLLPLYDPHGNVTEQGRLTCRTCHIPHGIAAGGITTMTAEARRAMRLMVRPFEPPNVCATCHGMDALRRFLYFHDPDRRSGPLTFRSTRDQ